MSPSLRLLPPASEHPPESGRNRATSTVPAARSVGPDPRRISSAAIKRKAQTLFRHFPGALGGDEEAVHQLRVSSRRLRVALSLLADKPEGRRAGRARRLLRQLTRTAGSSRDLDVLFDCYREHLKGLPIRTPEQNRLRHRLADARRRGRARMVEGLLDLPIARLRADLQALIQRGGSALAMVDQRCSALCDREGRALTEGFSALGAGLDPDALHALRRRARRLRYGVEIAQEVLGEASGAAKPWKTLQDLVGSFHDHHVLAQWLEAQAAADEKRGKPVLATAARAEAAWAHSTEVRLHDELLASRPGAIVVRGLSLLRRASQATLPE
jgi:CHAD domain-containing protein